MCDLRVIIDNGSGSIKAGISGQQKPRAVFPSIVGSEKNNETTKYVGDIVESMNCKLISRPIEFGIVTNWENMECIWNHIFENELRERSEECGVLLTEVPLNPKLHREKYCEIFFESFNVPDFYIGLQQVLSLYFSGRTSGLVIDSGYEVTHCVPIYEGHCIPSCVKRLDIGGNHISKLIRNNTNLHSSTFKIDKEHIEIIKEKYSFISSNFDDDNSKECNDKDDIIYTLPDGNIIKLNNHERFNCPEVLFRPDFIGKECFGLDLEVYQSIMACDINLRSLMYNNIVLSGGNTLISGFKERIQNELLNLAPSSTKINIYEDPGRLYSSYFGGNILTNLSTYENMVITKEVYLENGSQIVHRMCF